MHNMLIGLHGLPRSGKNTVAAVLTDNLKYHQRAFAGPLKEAAAILLDRTVGQCEGYAGFDREAVMPEWGFSMRWFLQKLGTECMRHQIADDFWIRRMRTQIEGLRKNGYNGIAITDVRFPNEANFIRLMGGMMVEITRPGLVASSHASDQHLPCDLVIVNNGTLHDLEYKVLSAFR